jgi:hypothetical protein
VLAAADEKVSASKKLFWKRALCLEDFLYYLFFTHKGMPRRKASNNQTGQNEFANPTSLNVCSVHSSTLLSSPLDTLE